MAGKMVRDGRMSIGQAFKRRGRAVVPPLIFLSLVAYFAWNATHGDRGLLAQAKRRQELNVARIDLKKAQSDLRGWEHRVDGLRDRSLELDALDGRARAMLNLVAPGDLVVPLPTAPKAP